ncbi:radical SAM protein [bacterium]|nr:radical SAM protein [bacterium]
MRPKILLINPWIYDFAAVNLWARPLGLLQVAEFLSAYSVDLVYLDCLDTPVTLRFHKGKYPKTTLPTPECLPTIDRPYARYGITLEDFQKQLQTLLPADVILMSSMMTYWYPGVHESIRQCKTIAPHTPICLGGIYPQLYPEHAVNNSGADALYLGPVNKTLEQVLRDFGIILTPAQQPKPYYRLGFYKTQEYAPLLTSRGCPYCCSYCASSQLNPKFSQRPPNAVVREIKNLSDLGVQDIAFYDDALLSRPEKHIQPIMQKIIAAGLKINFHTPNGLHARLVDEKTAELMKKAGFKTIRLSLETVNAQRQAKTGGKITNKEFAAAVVNLKKTGFTKQEIGVYLMYGLPGQPIDEIWEGIHFLETLNVRIQLTEFSPLPGTPVWQELVEKNIITPDIDPLLTNNTVFSILFNEYPKTEIKKLKDRVARHNQCK